MNKPAITEDEIIQMTLENVRSFYNRQKDINTMHMTDDFMWIGSNDFQWCEGLEEFLRITKNEYEEPPVLLSDEEYHLLFHERNVWVVYGRYKATAILEDNSVIHAHVRGTYVWRRIDGVLKLTHVHGSHAQDIPLNQLAPVPEKLTADSGLFAYMKQMDTLKTDISKFSFRGSDGKHRFLFPNEILYLKAAGQYCFVHTPDAVFQVSGILAEHEASLPLPFKRIHKSYLVNTIYIDSIYRYRALLKNGDEIPIGKERYMDLKKFLQRK